MKPLLQLAGIDVSARSLTVVVEPPGGERERLEFSNDAARHRQLVRPLTKQVRHARLPLEASGIYSLDLAMALHNAARITQARHSRHEACQIAVALNRPGSSAHQRPRCHEGNQCSYHTECGAAQELRFGSTVSDAGDEST